VREWKRGEAVRLRLRDKSYEEIQRRLGVSISFIAKSQKKYLEKGISGLTGEIESGELLVYALDECHLQGDDICNYLWGDR